MYVIAVIVTTSKVNKQSYFVNQNGPLLALFFFSRSSTFLPWLSLSTPSYSLFPFALFFLPIPFSLTPPLFLPPPSFHSLLHLPSLFILPHSYAKIHLPIIASVSEHQPITWSALFMDFHILVCMFPAGVWFVMKYPTDERLFGKQAKGQRDRGWYVGG